MIDTIFYKFFVNEKNGIDIQKSFFYFFKQKLRQYHIYLIVIVNKKTFNKNHKYQTVKVIIFLICF